MSNQFDEYIYLSGFGDPEANGHYYFVYLNNDSYPVYKKDSSYFLFYAPTLMPYTNEPGYYIIKRTTIRGAIPRSKVVAWTREANSKAMTSSTEWIGMLEQGSGETAVGDTRYGIDSSSSSSSSSKSLSSGSSSSSSKSLSSGSSSSSSKSLSSRSSVSSRSR